MLSPVVGYLGDIMTDDPTQSGPSSLQKTGISQSPFSNNAGHIQSYFSPGEEISLWTVKDEMKFTLVKRKILGPKNLANAKILIIYKFIILKHFLRRSAATSLQYLIFYVIVTITTFSSIWEITKK